MKLNIKSKEEKIFQPLAKELIFKNRLSTIGEAPTENTTKDILSLNKITRNKSVSRVVHSEHSRLYTRNTSYSVKSADRKNSIHLTNGKRAISTKAIDKGQNQMQFVTQMYSRVPNLLTASKSPSSDIKTQEANSFYSLSKPSTFVSKSKARSVSQIKTAGEVSNSKPSDELSISYSYQSKAFKPPVRVPPLSKHRLTDHTEHSFQSVTPLRPGREDGPKRLIALMPRLKKPSIKRIQSERTYEGEPSKVLKDEVDFLLKYVYKCDDSTKDMISSYILFDELKPSKDS